VKSSLWQGVCLVGAGLVGGREGEGSGTQSRRKSERFVKLLPENSQRWGGGERGEIRDSATKGKMQVSNEKSRYKGRCLVRKPDVNFRRAAGVLGVIMSGKGGNPLTLRASGSRAT